MQPPAFVFIARHFGESEELHAWKAFAEKEGHPALSLCAAKGRHPHARVHMGGSLLGLRRRFRKSQAALPPHRFHIYFNGWGVDALASVDSAARRYAFFLEPVPYFERMVIHSLRFVQGVIVPSEAMKTYLRQKAGFIPERLITVLPPPWEAAAALSADGETAADSPVVGFAPRLEVRQKRAERLLPFRAALPESTLPQLRYFGFGTNAHRLGRKIAQKNGFHQVTRTTFAERMAEIDRWDVALWLSSYEGAPQALGRTIVRGGLPLFPKPDDTPPPIPLHPACLYPAHEMEAAARSLLDLIALSPEKRRIIIQQNRAALAKIIAAEAAWEAFVEAEQARAPRPLPRKAAFGPLWPLRIYSTFLQFARTGQFEFERPVVEIS
ncbi:MAG: hypothetical protein JJT96_01690 [Opitutales bacterium]|nr:hypothetical protein [Opitutales bacterium]